MNLSPHFTLAEFVASETAARRGIDNTLPPELLPNAEAICSLVEPARIALGPLHVNSGYRCPALNAAIGGALHSQHMQGQALDLIPLSDGTRVFDLFLWVYRNLDFDQLIWEFGGQWAHVSYNPGAIQRHSVLAAAHGASGTAYAEITEEQILALRGA